MSGLVPFNKRTPIARHYRDFFEPSKFFEDFFEDIPSFFFDKSVPMKVDIKDNEKEYVLEAELPGIDKKDINIELNDNRLTISVNKEEANESNEENYIRKERRSSSFVRSFAVDNIAEDSIKAKFENGLLTLVLPKKEVSAPSGKKIDIQ